VNHSDLESLLRAKLDPLDRIAAHAHTRSDRDLNPDWISPTARFRDAAVLAPIVTRPEGWTMLFTERAADLASHAGQVSFPGGRIDPGDAGPVEAALREAEEEIGLSRAFVTPIGGFEPYETGSGYRIAPIVALIRPGFTLSPDPREVASVFETPLDFLMNPANHERREGVWQGKARSYYAMPHDGRLIWGVTAGMIRALWERLYG
jgi:8-oxo-dGTP pyrophosphatase MutT (NUDIX family)